MTHDHEELLRRSEEAPAVGPEPALPRSPAVTVEALQRSAGNAAVARMIQAGGLMRQPAAPEAVCSPADQAKLDELMSTTYTREDFHPDTGAGLFDAVYAPGDGLLTITLGIAFEFLNGDPADPTWVASVGPDNVAKYGPEKFAWTAEEILNWKQNAITTVTGIWQRQYTFFTTKACWADTLPPVNVNIEIVERPATGEGKAHFVTSVTKWPTEPGIEESVTPPGAGADQSTARFHEQGSDPGGIESPDVNDFNTTTTERAKYSEVNTDNPGTIRFPQNVSEPSAADKTALQKFGQTLGKPYMPPFPVTLTGHSSSEGDEALNMRLSEDRARTVSNEIVGAGAPNQPTVDPKGEEGAAPTAEWRRVEITVGSFRSSQTTIGHEFGHMFGLRDQYPTADDGSRPVGTPVKHSALAERLIPGQTPILARDNEDIMSAGGVVKPYHYVTFLEVLGTMTDTTNQWDIRPAVQGPGDFPVPTDDGTGTAVV